MRNTEKLNTGDRFGRWLVLTLAYSKRFGKTTRIYYNCKCDCGTERIIRKGNLTSGESKSCGCLKNENQSARLKNNKLRLLNKDTAAFNYVYSQYRIRSSKKQHDFKLTKDEFRNITQQNCFYCNSSPNRIANTGTSTTPYICNGIDRVDNTKGYLIDNIVPCCRSCNIAKSDLTQQEFLYLIEKIYENRIKET